MTGRVHLRGSQQVKGSGGSGVTPLPDGGDVQHMQCALLCTAAHGYVGYGGYVGYVGQQM